MDAAHALWLAFFVCSKRKRAAAAPPRGKRMNEQTIAREPKKKKPFVVREIPSETILDPRLSSSALRVLTFLWSKSDAKTGELRIKAHWLSQTELIRMAAKVAISARSFQRIVRKQLIPYGYVKELERERRPHLDATGRERNVLGPQHYVVFKTSQQPHKQRESEKPKHKKPRCERVSSSGQNWRLEENACPPGDSSNDQNQEMPQNALSSRHSSTGTRMAAQESVNHHLSAAPVVSGFDFDFGSDFDVPVNETATQGESGFQKAPKAKLPRWKELEALGLSKAGLSILNPGTVGDRYAKLIRDHEAEPGQQPDKFQPLPTGAYLRIEALLLERGTRFDSDPDVLALVAKINQHMMRLFQKSPERERAEAEAREAKQRAAEAKAQAEADERARKQRDYYWSFARGSGWTPAEFSAVYEQHKHLPDEELFARFYKKRTRQ
jgi:hypothetical protein